MALAPEIEPGRCDPRQCNTPGDPSPFINFNDSGGYSICGGTAYPKSVPIKQLLKGSMAVPWVRLRFEGDNAPDVNIVPSCPRVGPAPSPSEEDTRYYDPACWDYTEITTGNISQPGCVGGGFAPNCTDKCRAVIKSFQYGWGAIQSGNICKLVIHDESGSSFGNWVGRLIRNNLQQDNQESAVNKMKVTFGWLVVGGDQDCPAEVGSGATCANGQGRLICSPELWFVPWSIVCNVTGGKFIYELEGRDLLMTSQQVPLQTTYGMAGDPAAPPAQPVTHLLDAVVKLSMDSRPPFNVMFVQLNKQNNQAEPIQFWREPDNLEGGFVIPGMNIEHVHYVDEKTTIGGIPYWEKVTAGQGTCPGADLNPDGSCDAGESDQTDLQTRGPLHTWSSQTHDCLGAITSWLRECRADTPIYGRDGKGLTCNYDPTFTVPSEDAIPGMPTKGRLLVWADAIRGDLRGNDPLDEVKMGLYVVNGGRCSPVFSFMPSIKWHWNALNTGGTMTPVSGEMPIARDGLHLLEGDPLGLGGEAPAVEVPGPVDFNAGAGAAHNHVRAVQENYLTNSPHDTVEAELRVQGDPADWLCTPFLGTGRTIGIVVVNPFFLGGADSNGCPQWQNRGSACHDVLTNRNWFIKGAEHIIKEGSYTTNIKVSLMYPFTDTPPDDDECQCLLGWSGDVDAVAHLCRYGTGTCFDSIPEGGEDVEPGAGYFPVGACLPLETDCPNDFVVV